MQSILKGYFSLITVIYLIYGIFGYLTFIDEE